MPLAAHYLRNEGPFTLQHAPEVSCYQCEFDTSCYDDSLFVRHGIEADPLLEHAVVKRKSEFLAGRYAAQQAIKRLGVEKTTVSIGKHRSPVWPNALIGSLTHTATQAICAIAQSTDYQSIGIDLEDWMPLTTANHIKADVIQFSEERILSEIPLSFEQSLTLFFSAKESLFKALYPQVGSYFEFHAAKIVKIDMASHDFFIELNQSLNRCLVKGNVFKGHFMLRAHTVFTSIFLAA